MRRAARLTLLITAIGVSLFIENVAQLVFGPDPKFFPSLAPRADFLVGGVRLTSEQLTVIAVSFLLMIVPALLHPEDAHRQGDARRLLQPRRGAS